LHRWSKFELVKAVAGEMVEDLKRLPGKAILCLAVTWIIFTGLQVCWD
jgi:hypothetical protein